MATSVIRPSPIGVGPSSQRLICVLSCKRASLLDWEMIGKPYSDDRYDGLILVSSFKREIIEPWWKHLLVLYHPELGRRGGHEETVPKQCCRMVRT